jgi:hypothetical protein
MTTLVRKMKRRSTPTPHPYDSNDFLDLPDGVTIEIPLSWKDRIEAVCGDVHHCTLANSITRQAPILGILEMGPRGVSKRFVSLLLDPKVYPWAEPGRWYRGVLPGTAANFVAELDLLTATPTIQAQTKRALRQQARALPEGEETIWMIITVVPPPPSQKKGYRAGVIPHGQTGSGTKTRGSYTRRRYKATTKKLQ